MFTLVQNYKKIFSLILKNQFDSLESRNMPTENERNNQSPENVKKEANKSLVEFFRMSNLDIDQSLEEKTAIIDSLNKLEERASDEGGKDNKLNNNDKLDNDDKLVFTDLVHLIYTKWDANDIITIKAKSFLNANKNNLTKTSLELLQALYGDYIEKNGINGTQTKKQIEPVKLIKAEKTKKKIKQEVPNIKKDNEKKVISSAQAKKQVEPIKLVQEEKPKKDIKQEIPNIKKDNEKKVFKQRVKAKFFMEQPDKSKINIEQPSSVINANLNQLDVKADSTDKLYYITEENDEKKGTNSVSETFKSIKEWIKELFDGNEINKFKGKNGVEVIVKYDAKTHKLSLDTGWFDNVPDYDLLDIVAKAKTKEQVIELVSQKIGDIKSDYDKRVIKNYVHGGEDQENRYL